MRTAVGDGRDQLTKSATLSSLGELNKNKLKVSWSPTSVVENKLNEKLMLEPQAANEPSQEEKKKLQQLFRTAAAG